MQTLLAMHGEPGALQEIRGQAPAQIVALYRKAFGALLDIVRQQKRKITEADVRSAREECIIAAARVGTATRRECSKRRGCRRRGCGRHCDCRRPQCI
jgi:hypothetical protein